MIVGIDPGKQGAIAIVKLDGSPVQCVRMPLAAYGEEMTYSQANYKDSKLPKTRKHWQKNLVIDTVAINAIMRKFAPTRVFIENQVAMGLQKGQFAVGANFGRITGILELYRNTPIHVVAPQAWKSKLGLTLSKIERKGLSKSEISKISKERAINAARQVGYEVPGKNDGIAEAWLIAFYGVHHGA